ncbi:hypothetical protein ACE7GA_25220 [Roseomonas sp. CCTCC AB2023176]|uniref:hypothetical protein n=1 Tax=Roseomonas sp. CCTCC AB2023176 TaxID=3342640 RepID=UPI0035DFB5B7
MSDPLTAPLTYDVPVRLVAPASAEQSDETLQRVGIRVYPSLCKAVRVAMALPVTSRPNVFIDWTPQDGWPATLTYPTIAAIARRADFPV